MVSLLMVYSQRQAYEHPAKKILKSNLSAKRSSLKPYNSKTSPMAKDFLYNFLNLPVEIKNTLLN
jgi:hypothetical protein